MPLASSLHLIKRKRVPQGLQPTMGISIDNLDTSAQNISSWQAKERRYQEALFFQINTQDITVNFSLSWKEFYKLTMPHTHWVSQLLPKVQVNQVSRLLDFK